MPQTETDMTARLAEALERRMPGLHAESVSRLAAALLPVVRELQAEEIEEAAEHLWSGPEMRAAMRDRAAALRGKAGQ